MELIYLDIYFILWNSRKSDRKRKRKGICACWARTGAAQQAQPERRPGALVHARAPDLNLTGRAQASGREADGRAPRPSSSTLGQRGRRAHRGQCRARQGRARARLGSASCRRSGGGGVGHWSSLVRRRRGHAAELLRASMVPAIPGCKRVGKERGRGQWCCMVPDQERTGAEEACTARTPTSRGGGARARAALETNGWCRRLTRSESEARGRLIKAGRGPP